MFLNFGWRVQCVLGMFMSFSELTVGPGGPVGPVNPRSPYKKQIHL